MTPWIILPTTAMASAQLAVAPMPLRCSVSTLRSNPEGYHYRLEGAGQRGDCYAREYRRGAEYLFLLRHGPAGPTPHWAPLAPLNEQIRGAEDPWIAWVRTELKR